MNNYLAYKHAVFTAASLVRVIGNLSLRWTKIKLSARVIYLGICRRRYGCLILIIPSQSLQLYSLLLLNMTGECIYYPLPTSDMIRARNIRNDCFSLLAHVETRGVGPHLKFNTGGGIHAMHNASFAFGTWKRFASKQARPVT